ncbi:hypothetical protein PQU92_02045 [Asticcacaulis sp. BYS171W]|uniref:Secreted protein n=1 Tax=Asticcacaulis aquaticus TaxID=2984212 RepID=A0ABT5HPP2_9CAUL|nr:hypothetical protein [Asticcacaulis aquaticus]MDC7682037.1 hypothetical protein [Asticcacaulis aquaticus]
MIHTSLCLLTALALLSACKPAPVSAEDESYATGTSVAAVDASEAPLATAAPTLNPTSASTGTCREEKGELEAQKLADRCRQVSPATHPPCHIDNACRLIQGEIDRACALYGPDEKKPSQCNG